MHAITAVSARLTFPAVQTDIGRLGVVSGQHAAHHQEKIADATGFQGGVDGCCRLAGAEPFITHMGVRDEFTAGGGMRIQGRN